MSLLPFEPSGIQKYHQHLTSFDLSAADLTPVDEHLQ